eukprot:67822-Ditylum_brightwellii.AAC.1
MHPIATKFGLTHERFQFIWRHFHFSLEQEEEENTNGAEMDSDDVEDDLVEIGFDRVQREVDDELETDDEEDDEPETDEGEDDNESDGESASTNRNKVWYKKVMFLINHIQDVSLDLVYVLGTIMSLDEMM